MFLRRTDPFLKDQCRYGDPTCIVEKGKDCGIMGIIYEVTCNACRELGNQEDRPGQTMLG